VSSSCSDTAITRREESENDMIFLRNEAIYVAREVNTYLARAAFFPATSEASLDLLPPDGRPAARVAGLVDRITASRSSFTSDPKRSPRIYQRLEAYEDLGASLIEGPIQKIGTL
jgi:hypothetical protein